MLPSEYKMNNTNQSALLPNKNGHFRIHYIGLWANQVLLVRGVSDVDGWMDGWMDGCASIINLK